MSAPVLNTPPDAAQDDDLDVVVDRELVEVRCIARRIGGSYAFRRSGLSIVSHAMCAAGVAVELHSRSGSSVSMCDPRYEAVEPTASATRSKKKSWAFWYR